MQERIFTDKNGEQLIVRHRKSAVFFLRETDLSIDGYSFPWWVDTTPSIQRSELERSYRFTQEAFECFVEYMEEIALESWKSFIPKEADSFGADYAEYYDRDFDSNGDLSVRKNRLKVDGPGQNKTGDPIARLYKFNKRKFESFVYDLKKLRCDASGAATNNI
ncbi:hypothetical protein MKY15_19840 [Sporosarcina sp. FSL K6-1540]|uniref:hypothetical protein n=1 Tax=Sporosarcina sp. FSL K6-1540 TaxID=2921555 RepID=UPI00315AB479